MKVTIRDKDALAALSWAGLRTYLDRTGWKHVDDITDKAVVYQRSVNRGRLWEILVPLRTDLADYAARIGDAVTILARVEDRSELDVYEDLRRLGAQASEVDDATRAVHDKIRRWLAEEDWTVRDVNDPHASFNVMATLQSGPNVNIFQYREHIDHITVSQHWLFDDQFRSDISQIPEDILSDMVWNIYRDVSLMGVDFQGLDSPYEDMVFRAYVYFDGLTKDVLVQRILLTIRALSLAIRTFLRALEKQGSPIGAGKRQLHLVPRPDGLLTAAS